MELYSFESSPFSRLVRECLCELELHYLLRNTGKARWSDLGPPSFRNRLLHGPIETSRNRSSGSAYTALIRVRHSGRSQHESSAGSDQLSFARRLPARWLLHPRRRHPDRRRRHARVVMAHGLGGTRAAGLAPFAQRFADAGLRVLCFDYRHFGASDGQPRQLYSTRRQLDDWGAAIRHARSLDGIDPTRIALWGSSMSGGHVISAAVEDGYRAITPADWDNRISCAWMLTLPLYHPSLLAARLPCPILFCICTADTVVPPAAPRSSAIPSATSTSTSATASNAPSPISAPSSCGYSSRLHTDAT